jgi:thioredoxin 1
MTDDGFDKELENIRNRKLEELKMSGENTWPNGVIDVNEGEFKDFVKKYQHAIVDCWAPWCGPCRMLGPVIDDLSVVFKGKVAFGKLNTDENQKLAMEFGIMSIPTLLFFKNGELVDKQIGAPPRPQLEAKIKAFSQ